MNVLRRLAPALGHAEKVQLSLQVLSLAGRCGVQHLLIDLDELGAPGPGGVEGPGPDQIFQRPLVHVAARHAAAEVRQGPEKAGRLPLLHDGLDKAPADVFNGHQPEADASLLHGEAVQGAVDVRGQQGDAAVPALVDIARHLIRVVQHRGQQGRHVLPGIMALEVGRLISHHGIGNGVGLVESVLGEVVDFVVNQLSGALRNSPGGAALDVSFFVAVQKRLPLLFQVLDLLLAHGPADHVRLSQGVARKLLKDFNDLFLINNAAIGIGKDGLQQRMVVLHLFRVMGALQKLGDGIHGPGPVEGDDGGDVLNILGLQPHAYPGHAGGLHLEHAGGLPLRQHLIGFGIVLRDIRQAEVRLLLLEELHRVLQHRQVPQGQKVHL